MNEFLACWKLIGCAWVIKSKFYCVAWLTRYVTGGCCWTRSLCCMF